MRFLDQLRRQKLLSFTLVLFTLAVGVVVGTLVTTGVKAAKVGEAAPGAVQLNIPSPVQLSTAFSQLAKQLEPSVVNISTEYMPRETQARRRAPQESENEMEDFFNRFFGFGGPGFELPRRRGYGLGSGVVVDKAGYILTNNHVVERADRIRVKFNNDPQEYDAKVVGTDPPTDLAVIRVEGKADVVPARIGNSDAVQVGDWAVAIGSPFGFQATVTAGIISAKEREVDPGQQFQHFLQTDAAINPGNSGGPLLNIKGEVIGVNTAIASRSGGFQGIGFALPINTAVKVYNQIVKAGKVTRGSIGISFRQTDAPGTRELLQVYGAKEGILVQEVVSGGPSDKAGIKAGDVIVAINGQPIREGGELIDKVTNTPVGSSLKVTVMREGKRQDHTVTVGDLAQLFPERFGGGRREESARSEEGTQAKFGITIENLTDARRQQLNLRARGGVLVSEIQTGSFAEDIGMARGDVVVEINRQPINSVDDVRKIQNNLKPGDPVAFRLMRGGARGGEWATLFVAGTLPNQR